MTDYPSFDAPFKRQHEEKKEETFTVKLNDEERAWLDEQKRILRQSKDSTALKQLARIGAKVLHEEKIKLVMDMLSDNIRKNKRTGLNEV